MKRYNQSVFLEQDMGYNVLCLEEGRAIKTLDFDASDALEESTEEHRDLSKVPFYGAVSRFPHVPFFFLGLGVYRAWIEIAFVGSFVSYPANVIAGHDAFDLTMIVTMFACALLAKKISPFFNKRSVYIVSGITLTVSTLGIFASLFDPACSVLVAVPSAVLGGFGIALLILAWSELYSCLNPLRVALYYSASIIVAALLIYLCRGLLYPWLFAVTILLPVVSIMGLVLGFGSLPENELPRTDWAKFSFPWKPVIVMAIYAFAYGLKEPVLYASSFGPHSTFGTVAVAILVFIGVVARGGRFDFGWIYRIALPLMVGGFLVLPSLGLLNQVASDFCMSASYTSFSILIMLIFANICYRYGASAIWLFGIERSVRALFSLIGRQVYANSDMIDFGVVSPELLINTVAILLVVAVTMIFFSEKELSSRWGITFLGSGTEQSDGTFIKRQELSNRCSEMAKQYGLSQREEEVLLLLAQHKTTGAIERELFIANGTAKTHIRNIYRKLDIHSRDDLYDLLGLYTA